VLTYAENGTSFISVPLSPCLTYIPTQPISSEGIRARMKLRIAVIKSKEGNKKGE
jgi:hypothetical protein